MSISEHPLAAQLPQASNRPAVVGDPEKFTPLARAPGTPASIDDYLYEDRGQLGLHVVSFTDATLVVLYFTHTTLDLLGWGALLAAWTSEMHGRGDEVATPLGGDPGEDGFDALRGLGTRPTEPHVLAGSHMSTPSLVGFGLRNSLDLAVRSKECRIVCVPGRFVEGLRAEALGELRGRAASSSGQQGSDGCGARPFVSEGDVLAAWWTRLTVSQLVRPGSDRTITIQVSLESCAIPQGRC